MKSFQRAWSRRAFAQAAGVGAALTALLPPLSAFGQQSAKKRLICIGNANGTVREKWKPAFANNQLTLSPILAPLEPYKSQLIVVDGLSYASGKSGPGGHESGMACGLSGHRVEGRAGNSSGLGISIDQYLAQELSAGLARQSLLLGVGIQHITGISSMSYSGPRLELKPENDPLRVWELVFRNAMLGGGTAVDPKVEIQRTNRRSMLDLVRKDLKRITPTLGADDRNRLGAHLNAVEELDRSLVAMAQPVTPQSACTKPMQPAQMQTGHDSGNDNFPTISKLQIDLMVMALACDLTRVAVLQYGRGGANHRFVWLGPEFQGINSNGQDPDGSSDGVGGIHSLAHNEFAPNARAKLVRCHTWYASQVAYLLQKLAAVPEGSGTMLDNTLVVWNNELGTGNHSLDNVPFVLAGNVGGALKTGRLITAQDQPHNRLLLSILRAFGKTDPTFGDAAFCSAGPLAGLT
jgi:hypothetical protein